MFDVFFSGVSGTTEVDKIIAEAIRDNPGKVGKIGLEAFNRIVRRSLGRVGSDINKSLKKAFTKGNPLGLAPLQRHTQTAASMALTAKKYRPSSHAPTPRPITRDAAPGALFRKAMNYHLIFEESRKELYIGAERPQGSDISQSARKRVFIMDTRWQQNFSEWQKAGSIWGGESTRRYLGAIGMPVRRGFIAQRPERDVIGKQQRKVDPLGLLRAALFERLER